MPILRQKNVNKGHYGLVSFIAFIVRHVTKEMCHADRADNVSHNSQWVIFLTHKPHDSCDP